MDRTHFFPRNIAYLFSMDMSFQRPAPPIRPYGSATHELNLDTGPVYHALGELRTLGEAAVCGYLQIVQQKLEYPPGYDFAQLSGRLVIRTDENETLDATYDGVVQAGDDWHLVAELAKSRDPGMVTGNAYITTRFDTTSTRHRWLTAYQCIGYGLVELKGGETGVALEFATFDVYAMT